MADIQLNFYSAALSRYVHVRAIVPIDYTAQGALEPPYKTLYFLPGYAINADAIHAFSSLTEESYFHGYAVFIVDGENSFYMDRPETYSFYEKYVAEEIVQFSRKLFPLSHKREDTFIGGISMGGFGALRLGITHAETFSKIVALSPPVDPYVMVSKSMGNMTYQRLDFLFGSKETFYKNYYPTNILVDSVKNQKMVPEIFLCCGEQDLLFDVNVEFAQKATAVGAQIETHWGAGVHDTRYWNRMLPAVSDFLMRG